MKIFVWADAPTAPTGFGRSANHVLHALHEAGHELTQLAVNFDTTTAGSIPWTIIPPSDRAGDPYGMKDFGAIISQGRFDMMWTTFDPEVPWKYIVPGTQPPTDALTLLQELRQKNPGFKIAGWFPIDGGPLSEYELAVLGGGSVIDRSVTMSPHVYDLVAWTMKLQERVPLGQRVDPEKIAERLPVIPHGVDLDAYRIPTDEQRIEAKKRLGYAPDDFVIIQVERNQQRKCNFLALSVLDRLRKMLPESFDKSKVRLYQHMISDEENDGCRLGFNLPDLCWRYGLKAGTDVRWPGGFVSDEDMISVVYAAGDAFLSCSTGEGFQYPAWEALACGVPLVVPDADARKAWFGDKHAPNVHLYDARPDSIVMRGGYGRRMALPDPSAAASILRKMVTGKKSYVTTDGLREAGRSWVKRHANVEDVKKAWVDLMDDLGKELLAEREAMQIVTPDTEVGVHVRMIGPGIGDLIQSAPTLEVLREHEGPVSLEVLREQLDLATLLGLADLYTTPQGDQPGAAREVDLTKLYRPERSEAWTATDDPRFAVIADAADVDRSQLQPFSGTLPQALLDDFESWFMNTYGVAPQGCVALAFEAGDPQRSIPLELIPALLPKLKALGVTPVLIGTQPLGLKTLGVIDLTGQTPTPALLGLLGSIGAVVCADSGILHLAGALRAPTVGCYSLYAPETRWIYPGDHIPITPPDAVTVDGETFPAGVYTKATAGAWTSHLTAGLIDAALRELLGMADEEPELTLPESTDE